MSAQIKHSKTLQAVVNLAEYLIKSHWNGQALIGPDPGIRFEFRIWRFLKHYLPWFAYHDDRYFLQCQGYWIMNCWKLHTVTGDEKYREIAIKCCDYIRTQQSDEGYWEHPLPEWRGKIATVEGIYASFGLLMTYRHINDPLLLEAVLTWYDFLINKIGFVEFKDSLGIHYFYNDTNAMIPNNSTLLLAFLAELYDITRDEKYLKYQSRIVKFIQYAQKQSGELPYVFKTQAHRGRSHLLCYQYNSFQFQDLCRNYEITGDPEIRVILKRIADYLVMGVTSKNSSRYMCGKSNPEVYYYSAAMAAALMRAHNLGLGEYRDDSDAIYRRLLSKQKPSGGFPFSQNSYLVLKDGRSYPRYQAMILRHLLVRLKSESSPE